MSDAPLQFEDLKLNRQLLNAVEEAGYESPTPIQAKAIPLILSVILIVIIYLMTPNYWHK